jgi:hypothetical protein
LAEGQNCLLSTVMKFTNPHFARYAQLVPAWLQGYYNSPVYQVYERFSNGPLSVWVEIHQRFLNGSIDQRKLDYFERLAETIQAVIALKEEIEQIAEIVDPVLQEYRGIIQEKLNHSLPSARQIVMELYPDVSIEDIKYLLPETIAKDLVKYSLDTRSNVDTWIEDFTQGVDSLTTTITAAPVIPNSNRPAPFKPSTFAEIVPNEEQRQLIDKAMSELGITNDSGVCCLGERQKGYLLGFIKACRAFGIMPMYTDKLIVSLLAQYIQADITTIQNPNSIVALRGFDEAEQYLKRNGYRPKR